MDTPAHQQSDNFANNIKGIVDTISQSVQPSVPSIIETKNLPTFSYSRSTCESLTDDQKKSILDQVSKTKDSINSLKKDLKDDKVSADADNSLQYLNTITKLTGLTCSDLNKYLLIGPTPYQTNLNTKNAWILGGITNDDLVKDYINRINNNNNVTNCGNDTPFWNGLKCIACNDPTPIFNIATSSCVACPDGKIYDQTSRTCIDGGKPKTYKPNASAEPKIIVPAGTP